jgi:hypothetical protein
MEIEDRRGKPVLGTRDATGNVRDRAVMEKAASRRMGTETSARCTRRARLPNRDVFGRREGARHHANRSKRMSGE